MKGHQKESCKEKNFKTCINCEGNHPAFSRSCVQYKKQQLIVKTQFKEGLSYTAAINKLRQNGEITSYNYKKALGSKYPPKASTPKMPKFTTGNKFSVLQIEESQSNFISQDISQKSPKRKSKRGRDSSSEEGELSPKLNKKQKPKTGDQSNDMKVLEIVAEVHVEENHSMDDTIVYAEDDDPSPTVTSSIFPLSTTEQSGSPLPTTEPSGSPLPTAEPSGLPLPHITTAGLSLPGAATSRSLVPTVAPSDQPLPTVAPSKSSLPTVIPSELITTNNVELQPTSVAKKELVNTKLDRQEKMPEVKLKAKNAPVAKVANKSVKSSTSQGQSFKNAKKTSTTEPCQNKVKNLVRDYHMPPGFKVGK